MKDFLACDRRVIREKGRVANQHLKEDGTNRPPVDCFIVTLLSEDFGGYVVRCTYSRISKLSASFILDSLIHQLLVYRVLRNTGQIFPEILVDVVRAGLDLHMLAKSEVT